MILDVPTLVAELVPDLGSVQPLSVICVKATRPVFLVFADNANRPACVVEFGLREELERTRDILDQLHRRLPGLVPVPLACAPWRGGHVLVQSGLPGWPWFRLLGHVRRREDWDRLRGRAKEALHLLHAAIRSVPEWLALVAPGDELRRQVEGSLDRGIALSARAVECARAWSDRLDDLGQVSSFCQHGDYCLNNLLIDDENLGIIDFEEFGWTAMPMHDELGLALSIHHHAGRSGFDLRVSEELAACCRPVHLPEELVPGLFLHHLFWRVNQGSDRGRGVLVAELLAMIERFASSPGEFRFMPA